MKKICLAAVLTAIFTVPLSAKEALTLGTGDSLPFASVGSNGDPVGVLGDTSDKILEEMGYDATATHLPFARLYKSIHKGDIDVAIGVLRTEERAAQAHYSDPILTAYNILIVKKGQSFDFASLTDLKGKKIGGRRGFAYPALDSAGVAVEPAKDDETNLKKVLGGRLDAAIFSSIASLSRLDESDQRTDVELLPLAVGTVPLGIAFADEKFSAEDIAKFNEMLIAFKASDAYSTTLSRYGITDYVKDWPIAK
ncbi:MAG: transporter substrate-binding domain-containing protein [Roseibium sp.]|uniref:substrate-binding periplasmic protein n=1 Tax=Roseibium sp. TaxID=1936156 RepID=UPI00262C9F4E|nr:transporter substrate-binding domain-containing protein [Roseibium sp.]MCV0425544.1 transporter substrate-binding domain-containing protein [Roseibium sp.]